MPRRLIALHLLLALLARAQPAAAARRSLAQAPLAPPAAELLTPAAEPFSPVSELGSPGGIGGPQVDVCISLTNTAGGGCSTESDTMSLVYQRGSTRLPTQEERDKAISFMKILPIGGFDPAYFEGATSLLAEACGQDFPPCQPGEVLPLGGYVPADFEGGTSLLAEACGQDFPPCQPGEDALGGLLAARNYSALIKQLDVALAGDAQPAAERRRLLLNRAFCLHSLGLIRKALKDYEAVLEGEAGQPAALLGKAKALVALRQAEDASACLEELLRGADLAADLALLLEAQQLAAALAAGEVKDGAKVPLLPALAPPAAAPAGTGPGAAAPAAAAATKQGFASGFFAGPAAKQEQQQQQAPLAAAPAAAAEACVAAAPATAPAASAGSGDARGGAAAGGGPSDGSKSARQLATPAAAPSPRSAGAPSAAPSKASPEPEPEAPVDPLHQLVARTDANQGVGLAVQLVNTGACKEALALLNLLLRHHPGNVGGLAARGTALALLGRLQDAVADFSAAIELEPRFHDFHKRRGQALAALGDDEGAARDLQAAIGLAADDATKAEGHEELGRLYQKKKDYRRAQAEFERAAALAPPPGPDADLLGALALCQVSQGDLQDGIATYERALALQPSSKELWLHMGMALKELSSVQRAEEALRKAIKLAGGSGGTAVHAHRLLAQMKQGLGDHWGAVKELNWGISAADSEAQRIEMRFLRGACHHAVGQHKAAVDDYQQTLEAQGALHPGSSPDLVQFICLAFYQKEMALYVRARLDKPLRSFCPDTDLHPEFKELWCKKGPPSAEFVAMYRSIMQPQHPNWSAPRPPPPPRAALLPLLQAADAVGQLVQYSHQGFLPNRRQQRMAGLAALEFAQALHQLAEDRRAGRPTLVPDVGASVMARPHQQRRRSSAGSGSSSVSTASSGSAAPASSGKSSSGGKLGGSTGQHQFGWRDAMDIIVRWRQLAEPNDQVIWVDLLTEREFTAGFGSHTPMFTGQTKCVRYYMVFDRALAMFKRCLEAAGGATDANNKHVPLDGGERRAAAAAASTAGDMWKAVGTDAWVVVPVQSTTRPGHKLEGTRLTVVNLSKGPSASSAAAGSQGGEQGGEGVLQLANGVKGDGSVQPPRPKPQPESFEFSIRTPVTPARWDDYDEELEGMFERLSAALAERDAPAAAEAALRFAYYWYNFMPLARGSAFCGYVAMLGALLASGTPVRARMPTSYQTDWEAILESSPQRFLASVAPWMYPPELQHAARGEGGGGGGGGAAAAPPCDPVDQLPQILEVLPTMRARLEALNGPDAPRI
ncbi:suppressor of RPS4-RLD 1-like isoform X1 [Micractinium conductrix]|uniref:Suppressor of RPS4-RLD 1-like isoform X1 n=1 Tax=Micractinium conductrix TaxID=554055 RepID=A0A2P6V344_9CHLO|nr:suppressor of RPS4-RLD 1-like isoform X1 [Micractinium conductrix]|eukprot:PSC68513.1 suppressor of RPS4-RLD 1-like isoform X1 [Micractinium conductrix]